MKEEQLDQTWRCEELPGGGATRRRSFQEEELPGGETSASGSESPDGPEASAQ